MKFSEFIKSQASEIADREVEKITNDVRGRHCL